MSFSELKDELKERKLKIAGKKTDLIERLIQSDSDRVTNADRFRVNVKTFMDDCYTVYIEPTDTIMQLKKKLEEEYGYYLNKQVLYFICKEEPFFGDIIYDDGTVGKMCYEDDRTLESLGVKNNSFFYLRNRMR